MDEEVNIEEVQIDQDLIFLKRGKGTVLLNNGFQYHLKKKYANEQEYWKCAVAKKTKCVGSLTIKNRNIIQKRVPHSVCKSDIAKNEIAIRMNSCKQRVIADVTVPIPKIFEETVSGISDDGYNLVAATPKFENVKTAFYNSRNQAVGTSKMFYTNVEQVEVPPIFQEKFLFADYNCHGIRILIFGNEWSKEMLISGKDFSLDGTFNICPEPFNQLLTIHCDIGSTMEYTNIVPILYALLPNKTTETYVILFRLLQSELKKITGKKWVPNYIMADFEAAIAKAIRIVFPKTEKGGCYYHYNKAIWKRAKQLKLTDNRDKRRIIALCGALPLLPVEMIEEGWAYIESQALEEFGMDAFKKYFLKNWMKSVNFQKQWCVFGKKTSNE